jgi:hypothetical protein
MSIDMRDRLQGSVEFAFRRAKIKVHSDNIVGLVDHPSMALLVVYPPFSCRTWESVSKWLDRAGEALKPNFHIEVKHDGEDAENAGLYVWGRKTPAPTAEEV